MCLNNNTFESKDTIFSEKCGVCEAGKYFKNVSNNNSAYICTHCPNGTFLNIGSMSGLYCREPEINDRGY